MTLLMTTRCLVINSIRNIIVILIYVAVFFFIIFYGITVIRLLQMNCKLFAI